MKLSTLLKYQGATLIEILVNAEETKDMFTIGIIDYMMTEPVEGFWQTRINVPSEILNRKVDFFTVGTSENHEGKRQESLRVYLKPIK
jgi:hypothetical protein